MKQRTIRMLSRPDVQIRIVIWVLLCAVILIFALFGSSTHATAAASEIKVESFVDGVVADKAPGAPVIMGNPAKLDLVLTNETGLQFTKIKVKSSSVNPVSCTTDELQPSGHLQCTGTLAPLSTMQQRKMTTTVMAFRPDGSSMSFEQESYVAAYETLLAPQQTSVIAPKTTSQHSLFLIACVVFAGMLGLGGGVLFVGLGRK